MLETLIASTPWLRSHYARRIVNTINRHHATGRPLPAHLARLERQLRMVPEAKRAKTVEQIMEMAGQIANTPQSPGARRRSGR